MGAEVICWAWVGVQALSWELIVGKGILAIVKGSMCLSWERGRVLPSLPFLPLGPSPIDSFGLGGPRPSPRPSLTLGPALGLASP